MKQYTVTVNGVKYDVEIEEVRTRPVQRKGSAVRETVKEAPAGAAADRSAAGVNSVTAPMPGTIVSIQAKAGQSVKSGQTLMVLEAMKMENEIVSPRDGTVTAIHCGQGDYVTTGTPLCELE